MADSAHKTEPTHDLTETQAHAGHGGHDDHGAVNPMEISGQMVLWTWVLFAITLITLYKVAWKPILSALDKREDDIQESIDNAEKIRGEMETLEEAKAQKIAATEQEAKELLENARRAAQEKANVIELKAHKEVDILMENAHRDIETSRATAEESLRADAAQWARELAGKLIDENLDDEKNRALTDKLIQEL